MIDIAVPRDIDPAIFPNLDGIYLFNIDSLESVVEENKAQREEARREPGIHDAVKDCWINSELFNSASDDGIAYRKEQNSSPS